MRLPARWLSRLRAGLASLVTLLFLAPLLLMGVAALYPVQQPPPQHLFGWFQGLFGAGSGSAFSAAFGWVPLHWALLHSALLSLCAVPPAVMLASCCGFALNQISPRWRNALITLLVVTATVPYAAIWLPRFLLFQNLGLVGSWAPLLAPALMGGSPLFALLFFAAGRSLPQAWVDMARSEGHGWLATWWQVAVPTQRRTATAIAVLAGVLFWGNFIDPLLYLDGDAHLTAPAALHALELLGPTQWPVLMAATLVVVTPALIVAGLAGYRLPGSASDV